MFPSAFFVFGTLYTSNLLLWALLVGAFNKIDIIYPKKKKKERTYALILHLSIIKL